MVSEELIISECKKFNKLAQKELYEHFAPTMWPICQRYAYASQDAKDIMQEGFIKVFAKIKQYQGKGSFEGWMKRIMVNTAITYYHKNKKRKSFSNIDDIKETSIDIDQDDKIDTGNEIDKKDIDSENIDVGLIQNAKLTQEELMKALQKLPDGFKEVFSLYHIEDYKHKEIADLLNIDENTSRTRLLRAKHLLQKELYLMSIEKLGR